MARKGNDPVGVCPCPVSKCSADRAPLYRFANRAKESKDARKAGKFYGRCPNHGWFGYDGAAGMQAYIREHGKLDEGQQWETSEKPAGSDSASSAPQADKKPAQASQPAAAASAPRTVPQVVPDRPKARAVVTPPAPKTRAPAPDVWDL